MQPGDELSLYKGPVTTRQIVMYAGASGDFNPIHYDHVAAQQAGLGGVIAHGMLNMGFAAQLVGDAFSEYGWVQEIGARFMAPVRPGDAVELRGRVVETVGDAATPKAIRIEFDASVEARSVLRGSALVARHEEVEATGKSEGSAR